MFLFGWGRKSKAFTLADGTALLVIWGYFHLMFCPISFGIEYHAIADARSEDRALTRVQAESLYGDKVPNPNVWQRYGLLIVIAIIWAVSPFLE